MRWPPRVRAEGKAFTGGELDLVRAIEAVGVSAHRSPNSYVLFVAGIRNAPSGRMFQWSVGKSCAYRILTCLTPPHGILPPPDAELVCESPPTRPTPHRYEIRVGVRKRL